MKGHQLSFYEILLTPTERPSPLVKPPGGGVGQRGGGIGGWGGNGSGRGLVGVGTGLVGGWRAGRRSAIVQAS